MELSKLLKTLCVATAFMTASAASRALLLHPSTPGFDGNDGASGSRPYGPDLFPEKDRKKDNSLTVRKFYTLKSLFEVFSSN